MWKPSMRIKDNEQWKCRKKQPDVYKKTMIILRGKKITQSLMSTFVNNNNKKIINNRVIKPTIRISRMVPCDCFQEFARMQHRIR